MSRRLHARFARATAVVLASGLVGAFGTGAFAVPRTRQSAAALPHLSPEPIKSTSAFGLGLERLLVAVESTAMSEANLDATLQFFTTDEATASAGVVDGSFHAAACPDRNGVVRGKVVVTFEEKVGGAAAISRRVVFNLEITVDDNAQAESLSLSGQFRDGTHDTAGKPLTAKSKISYNSDEPGDIATVIDRGPFKGDSPVLRNAEAVGNKARVIADAAVSRLVDVWRDGQTCVSIKVQSGGSRKVKPREKVTIKARGVAKDGSEIKKPLKGELIEGTTKLDAGDGKSPTTTFHYEGPKPKGKATVMLSSVSNRGIGRKELTYTTAVDYKIDAVDAGFRWFAIKCGGVAGRWDVTITTPNDYSANRAVGGGPVFFTFESEPEVGGSVTTITPEWVFRDVLERGKFVEYSQNFHLIFYADGATAPWGAPAGSPALGIDEPFGGAGVTVKTGDFCKEAG